MTISRHTARQEFATFEEWRLALGREFERMLTSGQEFTSADVRDCVGLPPGKHHNVFGSQWRILLRGHAHQLVITGLRRSNLRASSGRLLPVYKYRKAD